MKFNEIDATEAILFNGTRKDVFDAIPNFADKMGFGLMTKDLEVRDLDEVKTRHDIRKGDFIIFSTPLYEEYFAIGYSIGEPKYYTPIIFGIGLADGLAEDEPIAVTRYDLSEDFPREKYQELVDEINEEFDNVSENFRDVLLIDGTKEQVFDVIQEYERQSGKKPMDMVNINIHTSENKLEIKDVDDIVDGVGMIGESQREDGSPQIALLGYNVDEDKLLTFIGEVFGPLNLFDMDKNPPKIIREPFENSHLGLRA